MSEALTSAQAQMLDEVLEGLQQPQKKLPSKYFYDERGSRLFEKITGLDEYYPTRTEKKIMKKNAGEISDLVGRDAVIVELGSGSGQKTRLLFEMLDGLVGYVPIDISEEYHIRVNRTLKEEYPELIIKPVAADYTKPFEIPDIKADYSRLLAFYPGSTIGNFEPARARSFLGQIADIVKPDGSLLIGVDLKKDREILERAYDDRKGVTAEFNKNILRRLNRELDADFVIDNFKHRAVYNEEQGRIEMHLVSLEHQTVHVQGEVIQFEKGETIHTENSYKYTLQEFDDLVSDWYEVERVWTDENGLFSLQFLNVRTS